MRYYAGIDGGQSSTTAVIGDEMGRVLGRGTAGAADEVGEGVQSTRLRDALANALREAVAHSELTPQTRFARIVAGISGYDGRVYGIRPELPTDALTLEHDAPIAHAGALAGEPGVIVIAGTGSAAYAVSANGARALVGGWGYLFGDEGSAFGIARAALGEAMRDVDAGRRDELLPLALAYFEVSSLRELVRTFYAARISRARIASFTRVLAQHAQRGSERAARFLARGADELVTLAAEAIERTSLPAEARIAFTGGVLSGAMMRELVAVRVRERLPGAREIPPRYDPAAGALLLAYRADGLGPPFVG